MIQSNIILQRIIKLVTLIIILCSCGSAQKQSDSAVHLKTCLTDYIAEYSQNKFNKPLVAMVIHLQESDGKLDFIIADAPESVILGGINELKKNDQDFIIGSYEGILCKLYNNGNKNYINFLKQIDSNLVLKADKFNHVTDDEGNSFELDLSLNDWDYNLLVKYKVADRTKEVQNLKGGITKLQKY